jgi:hypothetical protein
MAKNNVAETGPDQVFVIHLKRERAYWRGGHKWTTEAQTVNGKDFTAEQWGQIAKDPLLVIVEKK